MATKGIIEASRERAGWRAIGMGLRSLAVIVTRIGKRDLRMRSALEKCEATYRIENTDGKFYHHLVFKNGKVKAPRKAREPDFTFTLYERPGFYFKSNPRNPLGMVIGNKIAYEGNRYYLFQFGFIMSLVDNYFKTKRPKRKPRSESG